MAATLDLVIEQGADFEREIVWKDGDGEPIPITGYEARAQVRQSFSSASPELSFSSEDESIVIDGPAGKVTLNASAEDTAALDLPRPGVWDLELVDPDGAVTRLIGGTVSLSREATR